LIAFGVQIHRVREFEVARVLDYLLRVKMPNFMAVKYESGVSCNKDRTLFLLFRELKEFRIPIL
jgi:hypothetical protein